MNIYNCPQRLTAILQLLFTILQEMLRFTVHNSIQYEGADRFTCIFYLCHCSILSLCAKLVTVIGK